MKDYIQNQLDAALHIFYPKLCLSCNVEWPIKNNAFCFECIMSMSYSIDFLQKDNAFMQKFYGRVPIEFGASLLNFYKVSKTQDMMHRFKYKHQKRIGQVLGNELALKLKSCLFFNSPDLIIPVPLTRKKEALRGYNQAWVIGNEISKELNITIRKDVLLKKEETKTMTRKGRAERAMAAFSSLMINNAGSLKGKHVLIVDDIMTTGATLESCALKLLEHEVGLLSFVTLASAKSR